MPARPRLKKGDITLNEIFELSLHEFRANKIDDKLIRSRLDVTSCKLTTRNNLKYNQSTKTWEQTGREVKIQFLIKSQPISYIDKSGVPTHVYPIIFLFKNFEKGLNSPFKSRVGSLRKPIFPKKIRKHIKDAKDTKEAEVIRKENERIAEFNRQIAKKNIRNGVQLQFFYDSMWVWNAYGLLFGPNYAKLPYVTKDPKRRRNPDLIPFFSKHEMFIVMKILEPLFNKLKSPKIDSITKNEDRVLTPNIKVTGEPETVSTPPDHSEFTGTIPSSDDFGMG
jgi:hypothetical protein